MPFQRGQRDSISRGNLSAATPSLPRQRKSGSCELRWAVGFLNLFKQSVLYDRGAQE